MKNLDEVLNAYEETFDDSFPMFPMMGTPPNKIIDMINECISQKKDVYDMGYLSLDGEVKY